MNADIARMFAGLPGADLVADGLADVASGRETVAGELVMIAAGACGIAVWKCR